jgi:hypothetical protein
MQALLMFSVNVSTLQSSLAHTLVFIRHYSLQAPRARVSATRLLTSVVSFPRLFFRGGFFSIGLLPELSGAGVGASGAASSRCGVCFTRIIDI